MNYPSTWSDFGVRIERLERSLTAMVPVRKVFPLVVLFAFVIPTDVLARYTFRCGSWGYWVVVLSIFPVVVLVMRHVQGMLMDEARLKAAAGFPKLPGEMLWTNQNVIVYPTICSLAGIVAGMFGVGGGVIKGPLLLEMGLLPEVTAATTTTMILFTSGAAVVEYASFGHVPWDYGIWVFALGFALTTVGHILMRHVVAVLGRRSPIIFAMGAFLGLSALVIGVRAAHMLYQIKASGMENMWALDALCS